MSNNQFDILVGSSSPSEDWLKTQRAYSQGYVDELKEKYGWHTGEPTEEGWYLVKSKQTLPYHVVYWKDNRWLSTDDSIYRKDIVLKWQKIED